MLRVLLADDQTLIRAGLRVLIDSAADLEVVGEASDGADALEQVRALRPDVVLMDIRMPVLDGIEGTRAITSDPDLASVRVLVLTTFETDEYVVESLRAGASGFLLKDAEPEDLRTAIRIVASGDALLAPSVTRRLISAVVAQPMASPHRTAHPGLADLTARELDVLRLVAQGLNNAEIADALFIAVATAKTHVSRVMAKLNARDRAQLVIIAYESGLIHPAG